MEEKSGSSCQETELSEEPDNPIIVSNTDTPPTQAAQICSPPEANTEEDTLPTKNIDQQEVIISECEVPLSTNDQQEECPGSLDRSIVSMATAFAASSNGCHAMNQTNLSESDSLCYAPTELDLSDEEHNKSPRSLEDYEVDLHESNIPNINSNSKLEDLLENHVAFLEEVEIPVTKSHNVIDQRIAPTTLSTRSSERSIHRPTLADDSRSVKLSLPTNPINLMQSNAQFLNKSRNLFNFLTENSKNIMEKTLLSQPLTANYNSMLKTIHGSYTERKSVEDSSKISSSMVQTSDEKASLSSQLADSEANTRNEEDKLVNVDNNHAKSMNISSDNTMSIPINGLSSLNHNDIDATLSHSETVTKPDSNQITNDIIKGGASGAEKIEAMNSDDVEKNMQNRSIACRETADIEKLSSRVEDGMVENFSDILPQHISYQTLLNSYGNLQTKNFELQERVTSLEEQKRLDAANFRREIEALEETISKLKADLKASITMQEILRKDYNIANKERESMVMKYAVGEKQLIDTQRARDNAERRVRDLTREQELLQNKLRQAQGERTRICGIFDKKCRDVMELQKEVERLKEDVKMRDVKLKWTQNKLMMEMEAQKETQQKLDKATARINEMKDECEQVRKESEESIRRFQQSEENKAVTLDHRLKEQQAQLILERHVTEDKEILRLQLQREVETLKHRQQALIEENNTFSLKLQEAEKNRLNYESNLSNLKDIADQRQKEIVDLLDKVSELETIKAQLHQTRQMLETLNSEMEQLRLVNEDLQSDMRACRQKEAEMLEFTQKLTDKNVRLQSDFTAIEAKSKQLEEEHGPLHERINELTVRIAKLEMKLAAEQKARVEECEILAKHLAEQTQAAENLSQELEDSRGENAVLKRKQQITVKELTRELQQYRKRLEAFEAASPCNSLDVASRTGSNASLNTGDPVNGALSDTSTNGEHPIQSAEPSRQALMDRIIKLQEINVKRAEKLDFFEEHTHTLLEEIKKKNKLIQNYILHESSGAMGNNERDRYKAELARHGGIMASVYNQRVSDDNMTLELSLEINQKLQAVLEDALLKNITLKDNIDTLGEEIARLTMKSQHKQPPS